MSGKSGKSGKSGVNQNQDRIWATTGATDPRNRIVRHIRMRAGDLVPHELNPRRHPNAQREALADLYDEVGFARSLLAYPLPDGRLKLIDGHLRRDLTPDLEVDVEVLDVDDEEARKLLLSLDPLVQLAHTDEATLQQLRDLTCSASDALNNLWSSIGAAQTTVDQTLEQARQARPSELNAAGAQDPAEQFLILIECSDEDSQRELLTRFQAEGLICRALVS